MAKVSVKATAKTVRAEEKRIAERAADKLNKVATRDEKTHDSFQNFALNIGYGTDNGMSASTYGYNPITRVRILLEWIYRSSWLGGVACDLHADDMSRAGIDITSSMDADDLTKINVTATRMGIWPSIGDTQRWARLYGGAIAFLMVAGQDSSTPLRIETVGKNQFKGLYVFDRWMLEPSLNDLVTEPGPDVGLPKFYTVIADAPAWRGNKIHHSRCVRLVGTGLPYWQMVNENMWGLSILERLYDRLIAFDSATMGAAQLCYKMYLRTLKLDGFREAACAGGDAMTGIYRQVEVMRQLQSQEGITLIDGKDDLQVDQSNVQSGISDALVQFAQQLSGALQIPLVRLFGQSPAGLNSTGESDLRTYYDSVKAAQERFLRLGVDKIYRCIAQSLGIKLDEAFNFEFIGLWQLKPEEKANIANTVTTAIVNAFDAQLIDKPTAMKELKNLSRETGVFSSITDVEIEKAKLEPPPTMAGAEDPNADPPGQKPGSELRVKSNSPEGKTADRAFELGGLPIVIETPKGTSRPGHNCIVAAHYGYLRGTKGADGDAVDCFIGPNRQSDKVYIIEQQKYGTKDFDEHKVMIGFDKLSDAVAAYVDSFHADDGLKHLGPVDTTNMDGLKKFLEGHSA